MSKFEVGHEYYVVSVCNSDVKWTYEIISRTDKTVTIIGDALEGPKRFKIKEYDGYEIVYPLGKYSMCPVLKSERLIKKELPQNVISLDAYRKLKEVI